MTETAAILSGIAVVLLLILLAKAFTIEDAIAELDVVPSCDHKWKFIAERDVMLPHEDATDPTVRPIHVDYILQCEHCGDIKKVRT